MDDLPELSPEGKRLLLQAAAELAQHALELDPREYNDWNTSGVARYFLGDLQGAVHDPSKDLELREGGDPVTRFPLAMAHHRLGDEDLARRWYDHAIRSMAANEADAEAPWFRTQATRLLGEE